MNSSVADDDVLASLVKFDNLDRRARNPANKGQGKEWNNTLDNHVEAELRIARETKEQA